MILVIVIAAAAIALLFWSGKTTCCACGPNQKLSAAQIYPYAANAGFTGADLVTAIAIALAESSGNTHAVGDGGTSFGLWQIHTTAHPQFSKTGLFDPQYNANAAYAIYSACNGFTAWTTFNCGQYQNYMGCANAATCAKKGCCT